MTRARRRHARVSTFHLAVVAAFALAFALWRTLWGDALTDALEDRLLDLRFQVRGAIAAPKTVVVVAIDERTVDRLGWAPPPRMAIADAIERIIDMDPGVIAIDLLLLDPAAADPVLSTALGLTDHVVLAAALAKSPDDARSERPAALQAALDRSVIAVVIGGPQPETAGEPPRLLLPRPELVGVAALAHVNIAQTADRLARRIPLSLWIGEGAFLPAMSLEAARRVVGLRRGDVALWPGRLVGFGDRQIATDSAGNVTINHYGGRSTIPTVSLIDVLDGRVPPEVFKGRAVVLGATAESLSDLFATPYSADIPGAEIMATLTANLVADELIVRDIWLQALSAALALLFVSLAFYAASQLSLTAAFVTVPVIWMVGAATVQLAFSGARFGLDATMILAALLFATVWTAAQRFRVQKRVSAELTQERENLSHYVSPFLAEQLASDEVPDFDRRTQDAAVLFVDVAGYTALVEMHAPDKTAVFLGELHRLFERCATAHRGVISTFAGDGAMIIFGLPEPGPGDAAAGLACGSMLLEDAGRFASAVFPDLGLQLRVSMHYGPVTAAIVGGERHAQVTVTGDIVNVASRLQEIAKEHGAAYVTSHAGLDAARRAGSTVAARFAPLGNLPVRGRSGHIEVWALAPIPD